MNYPFKALIFLLIITISYEKTLNYIPSPSNYYEETNEDDSFDLGLLSFSEELVEAKMGYKPAVRRGMCVFATAPFIGRLMNESIVDGMRDERVQIVNGVMYVDNMEVVEIDTDQMNTTDATDVVAYLGNPHAIKFFDRKTIEIAMSTEVLFEYNAKAMRVIERFDIAPVDDEMLKFTKIK